jgi:hypothetical protein
MVQNKLNRRVEIYQQHATSFGTSGLLTGVAGKVNWFNKTTISPITRLPLPDTCRPRIKADQSRRELKQHCGTAEIGTALPSSYKEPSSL